MNEANFSGVEGGESGGSDVEVDGGEGVVSNMDGGTGRKGCGRLNQGGFGNHGGDEVIPVLNFNQDWFFFSGAKGQILTILQEIWEGQQRLNGRMSHLEDAIHQMNGPKSGGIMGIM